MVEAASGALPLNMVGRFWCTSIMAKASMISTKTIEPMSTRRLNGRSQRRCMNTSATIVALISAMKSATGRFASPMSTECEATVMKVRKRSAAPAAMRYFTGTTWPTSGWTSPAWLAWWDS